MDTQAVLSTQLVRSQHGQNHARKEHYLQESHLSINIFHWISIYFFAWVMCKFLIPIGCEDKFMGIIYCLFESRSHRAEYCTMAIVKLMLILGSMFAQQYAVTAPNIQPPREQLRTERGLECALPHIVGFTKMFSWIWGIFETTVLLSLSGYCPQRIARFILRVLPTSVTANPTTFTTTTPTFLAGTLLVLAGGLLRAHCFHALGPRFTFELSIRPSHTLVTRGVYGIVRHPSYTAMLVLYAGWSLSLLDLRTLAVDAPCATHYFPFSAFFTSGILNCHRMVTSMLVSMWVTAIGSFYVFINKRMDNEDAMLEKHFGKEWRAWVKRVPCRLVPGVC